MTEFSESVLDALKKIPKGKVVTYSRIAALIGKPKAVRAVGNALQKNTDPITVPCHRVVRRDGSVGGYALGTGKKIKILRDEGIEINNKFIDLKKYGIDKKDIL